jgi:hypothetical protein
MSYVRLVVVVLFVSCLSSFLAFGQQADPPQVQRDPLALTILQRAIAAAGGADALAAVRDFTGTGKVTFYWARQEVKGDITVRGRGTRQFRFDATLPEGVFSFGSNNGSGWSKQPDGTIRRIPFYNSVSLGSTTFPIAHLALALREPSTSITYLGLIKKEDLQVHHIRVKQSFGAGDKLLGKLGEKEFFIDPTTFYVVGTRDMVHPEGRIKTDDTRDVLFADYRVVDGIAVPFFIEELGGGQRTFAIQLEKISFNGGLADADFENSN